MSAAVSGAVSATAFSSLPKQDYFADLDWKIQVAANRIQLHGRRQRKKLNCLAHMKMNACPDFASKEDCISAPILQKK